MKFSTLYTLFFVLLFAAVNLSNRGGRATSQGWGNTGAPGDETLSNGQSRTCVTCHNNSSTLQVSLDIDIRDGSGNSIANDGYIAGETYDVTVTLDPVVGTPAGYGFQMLALNAEDGITGTEVSTWSALGNNVKSGQALNTGRTYVEHDGLSSSNEFMMQWTAPMNLTGPVTFYAAGVGANGNNSSTRDGAAVNKVTINSSVVSSTQTLQTPSSLVTFPNPVINQLSIQGDLNGDYELEVYDLSGRLVRLGQLNNMNPDSPESIDLSVLSAGTYLLRVANQQEVLTGKIVKQ